VIRNYTVNFQLTRYNYTNKTLLNLRGLVNFTLISDNSAYYNLDFTILINSLASFIEVASA